MAGIFLLLSLCVSSDDGQIACARYYLANTSLQVVMALASFLAGALPLSMTLSQSQLRLISSIGVGILVGTSLIVIIPEGIQAAAAPASASHPHRARSLVQRAPWNLAIERRPEPAIASAASMHLRRGIDGHGPEQLLPRVVMARAAAGPAAKTQDTRDSESPAKPPEEDEDKHSEQGHAEIPAFEVGFSMVLGFVLMFLIDRLPRHATESFQSGPQTTHMSLDSLGVDGDLADEEADGFLGSLTPTPRRARSLATTTGLVIHAAADGIAMGASSATSSMKLGLVIFIAIMIHKAPAAFGLTSVLLRQGLSKRAARGHLIVFSVAAPVGALATWLLIRLLGGDDLEDAQGQWWTGMLLLFSGGTFLYVAMHAMEEDGGPHSHDHGPGANGYAEGASVNQRKPKGPQMRDTLATVAGMFLPLLTQFGHHH